MFTLFVNVLDGCGKQFEAAVSLKRDIITSFDSTSDLEPQNLNQVGVGNCVRLLAYAYGQRYNVLKHCVHV